GLHSNAFRLLSTHERRWDSRHSLALEGEGTIVRGSVQLITLKHSSVAVGRHTGKNQHKLPESLSVCDIVWACRLLTRFLGRFLDRCLTASSTACSPAISSTHSAARCA